MPKKAHGKSHSTRPVDKRSPSWCRYQTEEIEGLINKLAKEGHPPSIIGAILRDQYAIPLVKPLTGKKITQILKEQDLQPEIPEDLGNLLKKARSLRIHLEKNRKDLHNKRALQIVESTIYKNSRHYKRKGILPETWKYTPKVASIT